MTMASTGARSASAPAGRRRAALEAGTQPFAELQVHHRRIAPQTDIGLDDDGELDRAPVDGRPAGDPEDAVDQGPALGGRGAATGHDRRVESLSGRSRPSTTEPCAYAPIALAPTLVDEAQELRSRVYEPVGNGVSFATASLGRRTTFAW